MEPLTTQCSATKTARRGKTPKSLSPNGKHIAGADLNLPAAGHRATRRAHPNQGPCMGQAVKCPTKRVNSRELGNESTFKNALSVAPSFAEPDLELWRRGGARAGVPLLGGRRSSLFLLGGESLSASRLA